MKYIPPRIYLYEKRKASGLSAQRLSRLLGVSKSYYCAVEQGKKGSQMTVKFMAGLIMYLNADADEMLKSEIEYLKTRDKLQDKEEGEER